VVESSEPEHGSTFLLTLPLAVAVEQPPAPAPPQAEPEQEVGIPHLRVISKDDEQLDTGLG